LLCSGHIQGRIHIGKELKQRKLAEQATKGQELIRDVHKVISLFLSILIANKERQELENAMSSLRSDSRVTKDLKKKVDQSVQDTIVATRIVDGFRNPQQHGSHLKNHATFPLE
jgi:nucleoporin p58/p45